MPKGRKHFTPEEKVSILEMGTEMGTVSEMERWERWGRPGVRDFLELVPQAKLHGAARAGPGDGRAIQRVHIDNRLAEVRVVEDIECFPTELQVAELGALSSDRAASPSPDRFDIRPIRVTVMRLVVF